MQSLPPTGGTWRTSPSSSALARIPHGEPAAALPTPLQAQLQAVRFLISLRKRSQRWHPALLPCKPLQTNPPAQKRAGRAPSNSPFLPGGEQESRLPEPQHLQQLAEPSAFLLPLGKLCSHVPTQPLVAAWRSEGEAAVGCLFGAASGFQARREA